MTYMWEQIQPKHKNIPTKAGYRAHAKPLNRD